MARRYVRDALIVLRRDELDEAAQLGVSELVANVCQHARTPFDVTVAQTEAGRVRIGVRDGCSSVPVQRQQTAWAVSGRGLRLLTAAGIWGVTKEPAGTTGKTVWFEPADNVCDLPAEPPMVEDWAESE